jgi:hypothetical protein
MSDSPPVHNVTVDREDEVFKGRWRPHVIREQSLRQTKEADGESYSYMMEKGEFIDQSHFVGSHLERPTLKLRVVAVAFNAVKFVRVRVCE